jgi:hypothetical protein
MKKSERKDFLWDYVKELIDEARRIDPNETSEIEPVIEKIIAWVAKYRGPYN